MNDSIIFAKNKQIEDIDGEIWKPVRKSKVYFVSNLGRVKSKNRHEMKVLE